MASGQNHPPNHQCVYCSAVFATHMQAVTHILNHLNNSNAGYNFYCENGEPTNKELRQIKHKHHNQQVRSKTSKKHAKQHNNCTQPTRHQTLTVSQHNSTNVVQSAQTMAHMDTPSTPPQQIQQQQAPNLPEVHQDMQQVSLDKSKND